MRAVVAELDRLPFRAASFSRYTFWRPSSTSPGIGPPGPRRGSAGLPSRGAVSHHHAELPLALVVLEWMIDTLRLTPRMVEGQHVSRYYCPALARALEDAGWRVVRLGSFNLVAPFVGLLSNALSTRVVQAEAAAGGRAGALLYALCEATR